jgi:hypothetical protein
VFIIDVATLQVYVTATVGWLVVRLLPRGADRVMTFFLEVFRYQPILRV